MLIFKQNLKKSEQFELSILINELRDIYSEFYLTKKGLRLFIKDNLSSLWQTLKAGDKLVWEENAIAVITGFADKTIEITDKVTGKKINIPSRKYVTLLIKDENNANRLLQYINLIFEKENLFMKLKKKNPILKILYNNGWVFAGGRGNEVLLKKSRRDIPTFVPYKD